MGGSKVKGIYKNRMVVYVKNTILFTTRASIYLVMEDLLDTYMMAKRPLLATSHDIGYSQKQFGA
jgi:hypothetical protein